MSKPSGEKPSPELLAVYQWAAIYGYFQAKYQRDLRDWSGTCRYEQDFWSWLIEHYEIHNGKLFVLDVGAHFYEGNLYRTNAELAQKYPDWEEMYPGWIMEILHLLQIEFGKEFYLWTTW